MQEPDVFNKSRVLLLAKKFTPAELRTQALQAVAALILQHKTVMDHSILRAEDTPVDQDTLISVLEFGSDVTRLMAAGDLIDTVNADYIRPPEDMLEYYMGARESHDQS